jgi:putative hydrolase of the HAD superfamily
MDDMRIEALIFDFGNTIIEQVIDSERTLDKLSLRLLPDVKPTLHLLQKHYRMGLLTNTTQSTVAHVIKALTNLSIEDCFDAVVTSYEHGSEKPHPSMFMSLLSQLNVSPQNTVMIGDDRLKDIAAARRLGLRTGYFTKTLDPSYDVPDFQFTSFLELPSKLRKLESL